MRLMFAASFALVSSVASAQPCTWSDAGTIVTPTHLQELRVCLNYLHEAWKERTVSTCNLHWARGGSWEDTFRKPPCVKRIYLIVRADRYSSEFRLRGWNTEKEEWVTFKQRFLDSEGDEYKGYVRVSWYSDIAVHVLQGNVSWQMESDDRE